MSSEEKEDRALDFIQDYGPYLFDAVKKFGGITSFLAAYAPKPAGAGGAKVRHPSDQVDRFENFSKKSVDIMSARLEELSPEEKRRVNEIFKKKQRRARPSAETWT